MEGKGAVVVTCTTCAMFVFLPKDPGGYRCCKCKLVALLEEKVAALEGEVSTLRQIKASEEFLDATHTELLQREVSDDFLSGDDTSGNPSNNVSSWRHVTVRRKKGRSCREPLELHNRFQSLSDSTMLAEVPLASTPTPDLGIPLTGMPADPPHRQHPKPVSVGESRHRRRTQRRVVVIGDSLLRGMEPVCRPDPFSREVCCLPGARIRDITERLPRMIMPADHHPFLLIHVGTNDTARQSFQKIVGDFEALGRKIKDLGDTQVVFSSILPVIGKGPQRDGKIFQVNSWLRKWCHREGFGFWDHRVNFLEEGLLAKDGLHLTGKWECPWHHCDVCGKPSISFCHLCPNSFCKDHHDETLLGSNVNGQLVCSDHIGEKIAEKKRKRPPRKLTLLKQKRRQRNKWKRTAWK